MTAPATPPPAGRRQRIAVYGICEDGAGRILLVRAAAYLTVAGQWFLPGGGLEHGEEPATGLARELVEETGLTGTVGPLLGVVSDVFDLPDGVNLHTVRLVYRVDGVRGEPRDEAHGSSDTARWVPLAEAFDLPLRPYVRLALTELRGEGPPP